MLDARFAAGGGLGDRRAGDAWRRVASPDLVDTVAASIRFANGSVATYLMSDAGFNEALTKWSSRFTMASKALFSKGISAEPRSLTGSFER